MRCSSAASAAHRSPPFTGAPCRGPRFCSRQKFMKLLPGPAADSACDDRPLTSRATSAANRSSSRGSGKVNRVRLPLRQRSDRRSGSGSRRIPSAALIQRCEAAWWQHEARCVGCAPEGASADLYKRVAPSDLVHERGHGKEEVRARAGAQVLQGLRRQWHLRARAAAQHVQGLRWRRYLRAWAAALRLQGLRRQWHLRARAGAQVL